jgi:hypothetical protein
MKRGFKARILVSEEKAHTMSLVSCRSPKLEIQLMYMFGAEMTTSSLPL